MRDLFVIVSGAPGSGKSTLAKGLAPALGLPLIMKDTIKEALADELGAATVADSKRLGAATMRVLLALMRDNRGGVFESTWIPAFARQELRGVDPVVEVFVDVPIEVAIARVQERIPTRHPVHMETGRNFDPEEFEVRGQPIAGGWPVVRVDGCATLDIVSLVERIEAAL